MGIKGLLQKNPFPLGSCSVQKVLIKIFLVLCFRFGTDFRGENHKRKMKNSNSGAFLDKFQLFSKEIDFLLRVKGHILEMFTEYSFFLCVVLFPSKLTFICIRFVLICKGWHNYS